MNFEKCKNEIRIDIDPNRQKFQNVCTLVVTFYVVIVVPLTEYSLKLSNSKSYTITRLAIRANFRIFIGARRT